MSQRVVLQRAPLQRVLSRTGSGWHRRLLLWTIAWYAFLIPALAQIVQAYPSRVVTITGDCDAELRPATAVVSGGVAITSEDRDLQGRKYISSQMRNERGWR